MKTENNNLTSEDAIMNTYVDELFNERMYKIFREHYGYSDDTVKDVVEQWKNDHPTDWEDLKNDFYDELHGEW